MDQLRLITYAGRINSFNYVKDDMKLIALYKTLLPLKGFGWNSGNQDHKSANLCSVAQLCPTLCDPMNRSTPGLPVHHQLPDIVQTRVHNHLIRCHPLLLILSIPPSIRVFSNESTLCMRWPKYWSFSFSISLFKENPGLISFRMDWLDLLEVQGTLKSLLQHHSSIVNTSALSFLHSPILTSIHVLLNVKC